MSKKYWPISYFIWVTTFWTHSMSKKSAPSRLYKNKTKKILYYMSKKYWLAFYTATYCIKWFTTSWTHRLTTYKNVRHALSELRYHLIKVLWSQQQIRVPGNWLNPGKIRIRSHHLDPNHRMPKYTNFAISFFCKNYLEMWRCK